MKHLIIPIFALLLFSCGEDFLEEVDYTGNNVTTIFNSEDGFEAMMNGSYVTLRALYGKENFWDFTIAGTDLYTYGADARGISFCDFTRWNEGETPDRLTAVWRELYKSLNHNNLLLSKLDEVPFNSPATRISREGEIKFLRAHTLYWIVEIWGGVHLSTEYVNTTIKEAYRSSVDDFYKVILDDLNDAVKLLPPPDQTIYGRINKPIAQAFLSKMYLTRGEYALAESYADSVINEYDFELEPTWTDIFDFEQQDNSEVVWPVVYSSNILTTASGLLDWNGVPYNTLGLIQRLGGHQGHLLFAIRYEHTRGMVRDLPYHRGFQRWCPTKFFLDLFNENVDQRFFGSFKDSWFCNYPVSAPIWPGDDTATPENEAIVYFDNGTTYDVPDSVQGQPLFVEGDTAMKFLKHPVDPSIRARFSRNARYGFHRDLGYLICDINDMYNEDETVNFLGNNRMFYFPIILKYSAPDRTSVTDEWTGRHAFVIRISDMYLVSAEAALMQSNTSKAYQRLETLANARAIDGNGAALLAVYGVDNAGDADLNIDFILDERARDLATEDCRFFDLKRTGKLQERIELHNPEAAENFQPYHALRPIPQIQLDAITNKSEFTQNPGY